MNCLMQKLVEFWNFSLLDLSVYYYRSPFYRISYDPGYCSVSLILRALTIILLGVFIGIVLGRLINAILSRIEAGPARKIKCNPQDMRENDEIFSSESTLPDEFLYKKRALRSEEEDDGPKYRR